MSDGSEASIASNIFKVLFTTKYEGGVQQVLNLITML